MVFHMRIAVPLSGPRRALPGTVFTSYAWQRWALLLLGPIALVLATGCAAAAFGPTLMPTPNLYARTPDNPFPDVPPVLRTSTVDVIYVTDREPEGDPAKDPKYGSRRSKSLAFGVTIVKIGKDVSWDDLVPDQQEANEP